MKKVKFETKKIRNLWYRYGTQGGYDHSFCSDNEYHAIELANRIMENKGVLSECEFPKVEGY
jgi:hypothetical protein